MAASGRVAAAAVAGPLAAICTPVPRASAPSGDVCRICRGCSGGNDDVCSSCRTVMRQVSRPCELVVPMSLSEIPSQLYRALSGYKAGWSDASRHRRRLMGMLVHFLDLHGDCIARGAGGTWEAIMVVPSSSGRPGEHPLVTGLRLSPRYFSRYRPLLVPGSVAIGHNDADDGGYRLLDGLTQGTRVLLLDDTFTSGARSQSAASVISLAGGTVVAIVVMGRYMKPDWSVENQRFWSRQSKISFDWADCCVH